MMSVVIIGSVLGVTYYSVNSSLRLGRASQERGFAVNVANTQIERLKALLDKESGRNAIFEGHGTGGILNRAGGWGDRFCLKNDEGVTIPSLLPAIEIQNSWPSGCEGPHDIAFPVTNAEPKVSIRYKKNDEPLAINPMRNPNDCHRFEIKTAWTAIGTDRQEDLIYYFSSHPILGGSIVRQVQC